MCALMAMIGSRARKALGAAFDPASAEKYREALKQKLVQEKQHRDTLTRTMMDKVGDRTAVSVQEMKQLLGGMKDANGAVVELDETKIEKILAEFKDESGTVSRENVAKIAKRSARYLAKASEVDL